MRRMRCRTILEEPGTKINRIRRTSPANLDFTAHLLSHPLVPRVCQQRTAKPLKGKPLTIVAPCKRPDKLPIVGRSSLFRGNEIAKCRILSKKIDYLQIVHNLLYYLC